MKSYSEKLKDPRWQKKRLEVLERDGWKCVVCASTNKTLHVHHLDYVAGREPWEYPDDELSSLCDKCHKVATLYSLRPYHLRVLKRHYDNLPLMDNLGSILDALLYVECKTLIKLKTEEGPPDLDYLEQIAKDVKDRQRALTE